MVILQAYFTNTTCKPFFKEIESDVSIVVNPNYPRALNGKTTQEIATSKSAGSGGEAEGAPPL